MPKKSVIPTILLAALLLPLIIPASTAFAQFTPSAGGQLNLNLQNNLFPTTPLNTTTANSTPQTISSSPASSTKLQFSPTKSPACSVNPNPTSLLQFIGDMLGDGGTLLAANVVTSLLSKIPFIGGAFDPADQAIDFVFNWWMVAILIGAVASLGVWLAGALVNFGLVINANLITDNVVINTGYGTILGLVNIGFVVAIIIMAFATMLRRSGWDMQSALVRLIIAALLINFSLFFAGMILNIGTQLTKMLLSGACSDNLVSQFNIVTLNNSVDTFLKASGSNFIETRFLSILSVFFASILTIIGALTLFGIFIFLVARYIAVTILVVFMPIIWLGFIFPQLQVPGLGNAWSGWWQQYLKWVFFGPLIAFFLYLTVILVSSFGTPENQLLAQNAGPIQAIGQMLVATLLSLGGLYAANKLSITGAAAMYGVATKLGGIGLTRIKAAGIGMASAPLRTQLGQKMMGGLAKGKVSVLGGKINIPTGTKEIGRAGLAASIAGMGNGEDFVKTYKSLPKERQNQILEGLRPDSSEFAAMLKNLTEKGDLENPEKYLGKRYERGLNFSQNPGVYKSLEKFALATNNSLEALAKGDIDGATKELTENIYSKAKGDDFKKTVKFSKVFKMNPASQGMQMRALLMSSPEAVKGVFKSLPYEDQNKFVALKENVEKLGNKAQTKVMSDTVKDYFATGAGKSLFESYKQPDVLEQVREQARAEGMEEGKSETNK